VKVCSRELPVMPQPLQTQLPPVTGSGLKVTCVPEFAVALAIWVLAPPPTVTYGVMVVALHVAEGGGTGVGAEEEPPPPHPGNAQSARVASR